MTMMAFFKKLDISNLLTIDLQHDCVAVAIANAIGGDARVNTRMISPNRFNNVFSSKHSSDFLRGASFL